MPPPFSAKKIGGKKFYELARAGEAVPDTPKKVTVRSLEILGVDGAIARFRVACTTGTYIRSLAHDIGKVLGTGAHLGSLRRTSIGPFRLEDARTLPALEALPREERFGKPSWMSLSEIPLPFPVVALAPAEAAKVKSGHGVPVRVPEGAAGAAMVRLTDGGELLALGILEPLGRGALALARPKVVLAGESPGRRAQGASPRSQAWPTRNVPDTRNAFRPCLRRPAGMRRTGSFQRAGSPSRTASPTGVPFTSTRTVPAGPARRRASRAGPAAGASRANAALPSIPRTPSAARRPSRQASVRTRFDVNVPASTRQETPPVSPLARDVRDVDRVEDGKPARPARRTAPVTAPGEPSRSPTASAPGRSSGRRAAGTRTTFTARPRKGSRWASSPFSSQRIRWARK